MEARMSDSPVKSFTQLRVWQSGHRLVIEIYKITDNLPVGEKYNLVSQLRRCAVSVTSNIAEGFGRWSKKEKDHFYSIASGSMSELKNQLLILRDVEYISKDDFDRLAILANETHIKLNGLRKANKNPTSNV